MVEPEAGAAVAAWDRRLRAERPRVGARCEGTAEQLVAACLRVVRIEVAWNREHHAQRTGAHRTVDSPDLEVANLRTEVDDEGRVVVVGRRRCEADTTASEGRKRAGREALGERSFGSLHMGVGRSPDASGLDQARRPSHARYGGGHGAKQRLGRRTGCGPRPMPMRF